MKKQVLLIAATCLLTSTTSFAQWNGTTVPTTTTNSSLGIGTNTPANLVDIQNITSINAGGNIEPCRVVENMYTNTTQTSPIYTSYNIFEVTLKRIFDTYPFTSTGGNPFILTENAFFVVNKPTGPAVGINKSSADYTLDVGGSINADGDIYADNGTINNSLKIGNVTNPPGYKLYVEEGILTEKVKVAISGSADWSDYVFADDYDLKPIEEVNEYIKQHQHLPGVPSAEEVVENGLDLGKMDATLLQKIEELTLYIIEQQKEIQELKAKLDK